VEFALEGEDEVAGLAEVALQDHPAEELDLF
jgi:hypothetical protein